MKRIILSPTQPSVLCWLVEWPAWVAWARRYQHWLSAEEQQRLMRYQKEASAQRFLVHRVMARRLLAHLLGVAPRAVPLKTDQRGKPYLEGHPDIAISFSHSGPWLAMGLTCAGGHLGLDVERILPDFDYQPLAAAYFHPEVRARIHTPEDFFRAWTLREAVAKAMGTGITDALLAKRDEELVPSGAIVRYQKVESWLICMVWWADE